MPAIINNVSFYDRYGSVYPKYNANAGDDMTVRIDFSDCCTILSSQQQQITYSALTGEVKLSVGSWLDEGFRVGDVLQFYNINEFNIVVFVTNLTIIAIPTDKIIVVTGLPSANNQIPTDKYTWVFSTAKQKQEIELAINWVPNSDTSPTPSMNSLIDNESQRLVLTGLNTMPITNGAGAGSVLTQVGKRSGSFTISNQKMYRFNNDTYAGVTRFNYTIFLTITDFAMLFPELYQGSDCIKFVSKIALKTLSGDTKTSDLYFTDSGNTGVFNEAYNTDISNVTIFPNAITTLPFNKITSIPFTFTTNTTQTQIEIGGCYVTLDDAYNENQTGSQNKYLKLLKTGLIGTANVNTYYYSDYFVNDFYKIRLTSLNVTTAGGLKTFTGVLEFDPRYLAVGSFGKFIEARGSSDRQFYLWIKTGNTNCLLFGAQLTFEYPVGLPILGTESTILNHDDNTKYFTEPDSNFYAGLITALDINTEDDLAYVIDFPVDEDTDLSAVTIDIICRDLTTSPNTEFSLERMVFDISTQSFPFFTDMFQNVNNNLPSSSAKKQAYLKYVSANLNVKKMRLYYPFLIRWEYWLKQLNATAQFVSQNKNNKDWFNYAENNVNSKLYLKLGVVRDGVLDYYYQELSVLDYDQNTNVTSSIVIIDNSTGAPATSIVKGNTYTIQATHFKIVGDWDEFFPTSTPYGQITVEQKESQPRWVVSTEIDADISPLNPLTGNAFKRLDEVRPNAKTIVYTATFDASGISGNEYCFTSKISEQGKPNNPIFDNKITEDAIDKITEDEIIKQIE
jgi:hypothetical protein